MKVIAVISSVALAKRLERSGVDALVPQVVDSVGDALLSGEA